LNKGPRRIQTRGFNFEVIKREYILLLLATESQSADTHLESVSISFMQGSFPEYQIFKYFAHIKVVAESSFGIGRSVQ
jgi:hypothetical protein